MKNALESANQLKEFKSGLSKFSGKEILSPALMNRVRGGDSGDSEIIIPPKR